MTSSVVAALGIAFTACLVIACAPRSPSTPIGIERVTLDASPCYGTCPGYRVSVSTDGKVDFKGRAYAVARGHSHVSPEDARALLQRFSDAQFAALDSNYGQLSVHCTASVTDSPNYTLTLQAAGTTHRVSFYGGCHPFRKNAEDEQNRSDYRLLRSLATAIDSVADSRQWYRQSGWK
jgi:hypothetical protein